MLGSNASIAFDTDRLFTLMLFQTVLIVHNTLCRAGPTNTEHDLGAVNIRLAVDVEAWPGNPHNFLRLGLS